MWYCNNKVPCISIAACWITKNDVMVMENFAAYEFKKKNQISFEKWLYYRIYTDKKYDPDKKMMYCIKLSFGKKMIDLINTKSSDFLKNHKPILNSNPSPINTYKKRLKFLYKKFPFLKKIKR
jgi:hypothetical protein